MFNLIEQLRQRLSARFHRLDSEETRIAVDAVPEFDEAEEIPELVSIEIRDSIDLHTFRPRDIPKIVEAYLLEARAANFHRVRIIHGKGTGTQRAIVRRILANTDFVTDFTDAPPCAGGWGATVVCLSLEDDEIGRDL